MSNTQAQSNASDTANGLSQSAGHKSAGHTETISADITSQPEVDTLDSNAPDIDALLDVADAVDITWVRKQNELDKVIADLATCGRVALDTELSIP